MAHGLYNSLLLPQKPWHQGPRITSILSYLVAPSVLWCCWLGLRPVKPTTESENRLQLGSLSTSVNIDRLTMVDKYISCGQRQPPLSGAPVNKWLSTIMRGRQIPPDSESGWIPHLFWTSVPPYRQCLTGSSWQQQQQQSYLGHNSTVAHHTGRRALVHCPHNRVLDHCNDWRPGGSCALRALFLAIIIIIKMTIPRLLRKRVISKMVQTYGKLLSWTAQSAVSDVSDSFCL